MNDQTDKAENSAQASPTKAGKGKRSPRQYFVPAGAKFTIDMGTTLAARRVRAAMIARGESARSTAIKAELSADSVRHVMSGKSGNPRMSTLKAIAGTLRVPIEYFTDESLPEDVPDPMVYSPPSRLQAQPDTGFGPALMAASEAARVRPPRVPTREVAIVVLYNAIEGARFEMAPGITVPTAFLDGLPPMFGEPVLCRIPNGLDHMRAGEWAFFDQGGALGAVGSRMLRFGSRTGWRLVSGNRLAEERVENEPEEFPHVWKMVGRLEPVLD